MRPSITPNLLATVLADAPARVRKRLDADPSKADGWEWTHEDGKWTIAAGGETVQVSADPVTEIGHIGCGCLLSPRCGHVLAVANVLPLTDGADDGDDPDVGAGDAVTKAPSAPVAEAVVLKPAQRRAVDQAWQVGTELVSTGIAAADTTARAALLRAVHACRIAGLHRLAAAGTALAQAISDLAADRPHFVLSDCVALLSELLGTAWRLRHNASADDLGVGRRDYQPIPTTSLTGLCTTPILSDTGYGGAVTYLVGSAGRIVSVASVLPDADPFALYRAPVTLGNLSTKHDALGRSSLFVQGATATTTGRVGGGSGASATATGPATWDDDAVAALWKTPLSTQLDRAFAALTVPPTQRHEGADLLFLDGEVLHGPSGVEVAAEGMRARAIADDVDDRLRFGTNLRRLATMAPTPVRMIARFVPHRSRTIAPLAVRVDDRMVNLGFETLDASAARLGAPPPGTTSPLTGLAQVLHRVALGGRDCAGPSSNRTIQVTGERLRRDFLPHSAELLERLHSSASAVTRDVFGQARRADADAFATAWTAAMTYLDVAQRRLSRSDWDTTA
ncbi:hypothetical protein [Stackebrandtia soli]|uniref:hypothetical protein n=1 Tax=Stackebrandtia soli TaxID=1892856 RepID=UPI0039ED1BF2